jgi:hypothetical protein
MNPFLTKGRILFQIGLLTVVVLLLQACNEKADRNVRWGNEHQTRVPEKLSRPEKIRLLSGELIGRALVFYAEEHEGKMPMSLEALVPQYLGTNVPIRAFELYKLGTAIGDYTIVAAEHAESNGLKVVIRGDGIAYFLKPGD